jgi:REP element-mobilizing transposase RayT
VTKRDEQPGGIYQVIARGVDRRRIFVDEEDFRTYTRLLALAVERQGWRLLCYCLMPNHVHLMIEITETNLSNGMQWLHGLYARYFNDRHDRVGHLFEAPFKSPVVTDETLVRTVGYIVVNPLDAALCARARDWPWSSHATVADGRRPEWLAHETLLQRLDEATGFTSYRDIVEARERLCFEEVEQLRARAKQTERDAGRAQRVGRPAP